MATGFEGLFGPDAPVRHVEATQHHSGGFSPLGFLGNVLGDARDTITGLTGVISGVGHDVVNLATGNPHDLFVPKFAAALPGAIVDDYLNRYGSPGKIATGLYDHPLYALFDALGVGDLAAKGAEVAAARGADGAIVNAILPKTRGVLQHPDFSPVPDVMQVVDARNPVKRFLVNQGQNRLTLQPIDNLAQQVGMLEAAAKEGPLPRFEQLRLNRYKGALRTAQSTGTTVFEQPSYAKLRVRRAANELVARSITTSTHARNQLGSELSDIMAPLASYTDRDIRSFTQDVLMGVDDGGLHHWAPEELIPQIQSKGFRDLPDAIAAVGSGTDPRVQALGHDEVAALRRAGGLDSLGYVRSMRPLRVQDLSTAPAVQTIADPQQLHAAAQQAEVPLLDSLRQVYGNQAVLTRIKPVERLVNRTQTVGPPVDALGARVTIGSWGEAEAELAKLQQTHNVVAISDTRANPLPTGQRRLAATVATPSGVLAEVEFGTPRFAATRNATSFTEHWIETKEAEYQRTLAQMQQPGLDPKAHAQAVNAAAILDRQIRYGNYMNQSVWEGQADEIAAAAGDAMPGGVKRTVLNDIRRWVWGTFTDPIVRSGMFDPAAAFDRAYLPKRIEAGGQWEPEMMDFTGPSSEQLHLERQAQDLPMPVYVPFYDISRERPSDMLFPRKLIGGQHQVENPHHMKRATGALYASGQWSGDLKGSLMRRAVEALRLRDTVDLYKSFFDTNARPIDTVTEIDPKVEELASPEGMMAFYNAKIGLNDRLLKQMGETAGLTEEQLATIMEEFGPKLQRSVLGVTTKGVQLYAVPKQAAEMFRRHYRVDGMERGARLFWDTPNGVWRGLVLAGSPRWVTNNVLGSSLFTVMHGARLRDVFRYAGSGVTERLQPGKTSFRQAMQEVAPAGYRDRVHTGLFVAEGPKGTTHLGEAADTRTGQFYDAVSRTWHSNRVLSKVSGFGQTMRAINAAVEDAFRSTSFVHEVQRQAIKDGAISGWRKFWTSKEQLRQLAQHGVTEETARRALDAVNYFHNDYELLGPVERQVIRRFMVPFYSFYKHITRLAMRFPFDYGARNAVITGLARLDNEMQREMVGAVPAWLRGAYPLGPSTFFSGSAANPFSGLTSFTDTSFISLAYPLPKLLFEQATGRSTLTGRQFTDANVVYPFGTDQGYRVVTDGAGNPTDMIPVDKAPPGLLEAALQQVPQYQLLKDAIAGGKPYDTETLPSIVQARLQGRDPRALNARGESLPMSAADILGRFVGMPIYNYDVAKYQENLARGAGDALTQFQASRAPGPLPQAPPPPGGYEDAFAGLF